jgi:hypothetical protein
VHGRRRDGAGRPDGLSRGRRQVEGLADVEVPAADRRIEGRVAAGGAGPCAAAGVELAERVRRLDLVRAEPGDVDLAGVAGGDRRETTSVCDAVDGSTSYAVAALPGIVPPPPSQVLPPSLDHATHMWWAHVGSDWTVPAVDSAEHVAGLSLGAGVANA